MPLALLVVLTLVAVLVPALARPSAELASAAVSAGALDSPGGRMRTDREKDRGTPEARAERKASRAAYRALGDREARQTGERFFARAVKAPVWGPLAEGSPGQRPGEFLGDHARLIDNGPGETPSVVDSVVPLRVEDESGEKRETSFSLEQEGGAYEPENVPVPVRLPKRLSEGASLPEAGVRMTPESSGGEQTGEVVGEKLFYANAEKDTDVMLAPHPRGLESFHVLRSSAAPERLGLDFSLPDGADLVPAPAGLDRGARIVRDGEELASVRPPEAHDADGTRVPVRYELSGRRLTLVVPHRSEDLRYPLMVDPVIEDQATWRDNPYLDFRGWRYNRNGVIFEAQNGGYGRGLYIHKDEADVYDGWWGQWYYSAPGDAFVYRGDYIDAHHEDYSSSVDEYISGGGDQFRTYNGGGLDRSLCTQDNCAVGPARNGTTGNAMAFKLNFHGTFRRQRTTRAVLGGARVYMHDTHAPGIAGLTDTETGRPVSELSGRWTNKTTRSVEVRGQDGGLGIRRLRVKGMDNALLPGSPSVAGSTSETALAAWECTAQCPRDVTRRVTYTVPEGAATEVKAVVRDNVDHPSSLSSSVPGAHRWTVKADTRAPRGPFASGGGSAEPTPKRSGTLPEDGRWHGPEDFNLKVGATDGKTGDLQSGVASITTRINDAQLNGQPLYKHDKRPAPGCADNCALSAALDFADTDFRHGANKVTLVVRDNAGNAYTKDYLFKLDRRPPVQAVTGSLWEARDTKLTAPAYDLNVDAKDGPQPVTHRDTQSTALPAAGTTATVARPVGLARGDVVYLFAGGSGGTAEPSGVPAGFAPVGGVNNTTAARLAIYRKVIADPAAEPAGYAVSWPVSAEHTLAASAYAGVDPRHPEDAPVKLRANPATDNACPTTTTESGNARVVCAYFGANGTAVNWPAETAERAEAQTGPTSADRTLSVADELRAEPGQSPARAPQTPAPDINVTATLALRPADPAQPEPAPSPITHRDTQQAALTAAGTGLSVNRPRGLVNGDVVYLFAGGSGGSTDPASVPAGFTQVAAAASGLPQRTSVYRKLITDAASEPATYAVAWPVGAEHTLVASAYAGLDPAQPEDAAPVGRANGPGDNTCPAVTTRTRGAMLVCSFHHGDGGGVTWPGAMTERSEAQTGATTSDRTLSSAEEPRPFEGPTEPRAPSAGTAGANVTVALALRPKSPPPAAPVTQSGMGSVEILVDGERRYFDTQPCEEGNCAMARSWRFTPAEYRDGEHVVSTISTDRAGLATRRSFRVTVGSPLFEPANKIGLEQFWHYDTTETGAGTQAHVNVATGNLAWHSTPVVNPGRGLSSVVNLTYNSQGAVGDEVLGYAEAGKGFSLGASGLTRVNEPLDLKREAVGIIELMDLDGTRHRFNRAPDGTYTPPPGVNLHLRRFSASKPEKTWAATRPDGATHFFDARGYQTLVEDRNGNVLRYDYERVLPTGRPCPLGAADPVSTLVCEQRLTGVTDSAGVLEGAPNRTLRFTYHDAELTGPGLPAVGSLGRIKDITDHAGRVTAFAYDELGYLKRMTQARGTPAERAFGFAYEAAGAGVGGLDRDLTSVTDPRGAATDFTYKTDTTDALPSSPAFLGKRVETVKKRHTDATRPRPTRSFAYTRGDGALAAPPNQTRLTDARGFATTFKLDAEARLREQTDARGTRTALEWDADNNVGKLTEAAGAPEQTVTQMLYNANGLLTDSTKAAGTPGARRTELRYRDGAGTQALQSEVLADGGRGFVSDLTSMTTPKGTATPAAGDYTTTFEPDAQGNVRAQVEPGGHRAETGFDARGQITSERDQVGAVTTYADFDPNGMPRTQTDPRGGRWLYRYDAVGNVLERTDPRGSATGDKFRTTITYDALDRVTSERKPKDSAGGVFVTTRSEYDANGNKKAQVDATGARGESTYTAMDKPAEQRSPAVKHFGEGDASASEVTKMAYDAEDNAVEETRPEGARTAQADDHSTVSVYDEVGQRVAEIRRSRDGGESKDLATSSAFDRRGNVVGMVDPRRNARFGGQPEGNAKVPERRRFTYAYDAVDNRTAQIEDPGDLALRTETRYDLNDNPEKVIDPRGFIAGADPANYTSRTEYDQRDLMTAEVDPTGARTTYVPRADGKLSVQIAPKGNASPEAGDFETRYEYLPTGEVKSQTQPYAANQYGLQKDASGSVVPLKVAYERDPVGDPTRITDARGNAFANAFYDTGDLKSTERPGWWGYARETSDEDTGAAEGGSVSAEEEGSSGSADGAEPSGGSAAGAMSEGGEGREGEGQEGEGQEGEGQEGEGQEGEGQEGEGQEGEGSRELVERGPSSGSGEGTELPSSEGQGDFGSVEPEKRPGMLPKAGRTSFDYDQEMRLTAVTDAAGAKTDIGHDALGRTTEIRQPLDAEAGSAIVRTHAYDRNGNLREQAVGGQSVETRVPTTTAYDQFDRPVSVATPGSKAKAGAPADPKPGDYEEEVTRTGYDENGNPVARQTARGPDFTARMAYDGLDRMSSEVNPAGEETRYGYDPAGNQTTETRPKGNTGGADPAPSTTRTDYDARNLMTRQVDGLGQETRMSYDANANQVELIAPGAKRTPEAALEPRVTRTTHDGRDLPWAQTTGTGPEARTQLTEFDGNGNLRREVKPGGVDEATKLPLAADPGGSPSASSEASRPPCASTRPTTSRPPCTCPSARATPRTPSATARTSPATPAGG